MPRGYNIYGLKVNTSFKLGDYAERAAYAKPDAKITFTKFKPPSPDTENTLFKPFSANNNKFYYLTIPGIAQYYVTQNAVKINLHDKTKKMDAITFLKDTILAVLLIKNNLFPIFSAAVRAKDGGIYVFSAPRGEGKSSLAAALCLKGHRLVSDNICVLTRDKDQDTFKTKNYYPNIELWRTLFPFFGKRLKQFKTKKLRQEIQKFAFDFSKYTYKKTDQVRGIYLIQVANEDVELSIEELKGIKKMQYLKNYIYCSFASKSLEKEKDFFKYHTQLSKHMPIHIVKRSRLTKLNDFANFINNEVLTETT